MITCKECIETLRDDPRIRSGRYHMCGCGYCSKLTYYRELEEIVNTHDTPSGLTERDDVNQLNSHILFLQGKVLAKSKRNDYTNRYKYI